MNGLQTSGPAHFVHRALEAPVAPVASVAPVTPVATVRVAPPVPVVSGPGDISKKAEGLVGECWGTVGNMHEHWRILSIPCRVLTCTVKASTVQGPAPMAFKRQILDYGRSIGDIHEPGFRELKQVEKEVAKLMRKDIASFYDQLLADIQASGEMADHRMVYRLLMRLGRQKSSAPSGPRPLPLLRTPMDPRPKPLENNKKFG